ncbi:cobalamin trafficking protein CblD-like [Phlebotomus argentipes]|uniref:cobalamin trafficking protein CblD-like n=1 Tax=Phlebotomus argentipes TaxID=94469 RepID=UPI002892D786|nr:cobalamin trafficking protein CblD-like [Phlebotomus argentipes]
MSILLLKRLKVRVNAIETAFAMGCLKWYSRKSDPKNIDSSYKIVKIRDFQDDGGPLGGEGGSLALFSPSRFYLPGSLGPAWLTQSTTISSNVTLEDLVDFDAKSPLKFHVTCQRCPLLIRNTLKELFPTAPEVASPSEITLVTLASPVETEKSAKDFVLAAREICSRLRHCGYWGDFINPFSGKPFYSYTGGSDLYTIDERFRGFGMKIEDANQCRVISADSEPTFSANVFTNAPANLDVVRSLLEE